MLSYLLRRLLLAIPVLFLVVTITFFFMRLSPGSPFSLDRGTIPPRVLQELEARYKISGPVHEQYLYYLMDLLRGDLRLSTKYRDRSVNEILAQTLPISMMLGFSGLLIALLIGIPLGVVAATHHGQTTDIFTRLIALVGISTPSFLLAPLLILMWGISIPIFPVAGFDSPLALVLPSLCLGLPAAAAIARLMRTSLLEVLSSDFIRTARAKGLSENKVVYKHALKVAILPIISYCGPLAAHLLTGSIVVETIFHIPGMGPFFVNSVLNRDVFLIGGVVLTFSLLLILFNLVTDLLYTFVDKRIRLS
ncbi:MAG: ABC transporter permease [Methylacidiphilales bacterium]|nr:ABC transporter permease [Candidatus Methylacidiphilales bacterium]MDW8348760.1 ABC transporter permease [Verrucomicrobiae bacterium]